MKKCTSSSFFVTGVVLVVFATLTLLTIDLIGLTPINVTAPITAPATTVVIVFDVFI